MIKRYNKLIRDKILEIIKDSGEKPYWRVLHKKEYHQKLKEKILEESKELVGAGNREDEINEIVDLQELIHALALNLRLTNLQIKKHQKEKSRKRGGFKKRLFLIKTKK